jgi:opacity protein-like surface antigen
LYLALLHLRRPALILVLSLFVSLPVFAQRPRPDRPYRGLFGGNAADPTSTQQFDLSVSLSGAYDDNVFAERGQSVTTDPRYLKSGAYGSGNLSLDYTKKVGKGSVDMSAGTTYRYYPTIKELNGFSYFASVGFTANLGRRTTLRATESGSYTPYFAFGLFPGLTTRQPGEVAPIDPQRPLVSQTAVMASSSAALDHRLTPRSSLTADYNFSYTDYQAQARPYTNYAAGAGFSYRTSPRSSIRLGYHFRRATLGYVAVNRPVDSHDLDIGLDYSRPLSRSRKATIGFKTGSSVYRSFDPLDAASTTPGSTASAADLYRRTHYTATGSAFLTWQIRRSWSARANYQRGLQFVEGFPDPFFADSVSAIATGFLGSRSRLNFSAAYTNGQMGITINARPYTTASGVASYQVALSRSIAVFTEYDYYHYRFDPSVQLPFGMSRSMDRQSVKVGLNLWAPLLR